MESLIDTLVNEPEFKIDTLVSVLTFRILFFYLIFILYWSIVDLQYCVSFRYTAKRFSYTYTYIHSFFRYFSHIGYHRIVSRFSCAIQYVLVGYLSCVYVNPKLLNLSLLPNVPSFGNHKFVFDNCTSVSVVWISSFVPFFKT